jgi:hypothetical protein
MTAKRRQDQEMAQRLSEERRAKYLMDNQLLDRRAVARAKAQIEKHTEEMNSETSLTIDGYRVPGMSRPLNEAEYRIWLSLEGLDVR